MGSTARTDNQKALATTVMKALDVLEILAGAEYFPLTIGEIAARCGLSRPTAHRLVITLARRGYLATTPDRRYRLGPKVLSLARALMDVTGLPTVARPILATLAHALGETVFLGMLDGAEVLYLDKFETPRSARMYSVVGTRNPVYCTALGKSLLAFLPDNQQQQILRRVILIRRARNTHRTIESLMRDLEETRRRGYAVDDVENEQGIRCIGVPILNANGYPVAAISVAGPETRLTRDRIAEIAPAVVEAAHQISVQLGQPFGLLNST
jgi:DNA-binding IclR family transcriptional regulator